MRYFEKNKKAKTGPVGQINKDLNVYEGQLADAPKRKRTKHLVQRKKHKDNLNKIAKLSDTRKKTKSVYEEIAERKKNRKETNLLDVKDEFVEIPKEKLEKYSRGKGFDGTGIKTHFHKKKLLQREKTVQWAAGQAARTETLLHGDAGIIEADDGEVTRQYRQNEIVKNVDITSAAKRFELDLRQFGPYRMNFTNNGRHLALGGRRGHVAGFDWITKKLMFEINVMEDVFDVQWLHNETMVATAQKEWVYMYDKVGTEVHCLKQLNKVLYLEFLPYHFLLSSVNVNGWLGWLDVSIGKLITQTNTHIGRPSVMVQNPYNAVICLGNSKGVVSMWSPTVNKPLAKMLCHKMTVQGIAIDQQGMYMATSAPDHTLRIWDMRKLEGPLQSYHLRSGATHLSFSQQGLLATSLGNIIEVYKECCRTTADKPYLKHCIRDMVSDMSFCPYEDVLGIGTRNGYQSILVPGSGEPNFDALEANPFQTKKQRREAEVKSLLDKIQPDMISLDPTTVAEVDVPSLKDKLEAKRQLLLIKPPKIDFTPRVKKKKHGNTVRMARSKKIVISEAKQEFVKEMKRVRKEIADNEDQQQKNKPFSVFNRFQEKKT